MDRIFRHFVLFLGGCLFFSSPAFAYIDPGSGSMMVQVIIAGIAAGWVAFKVWWHRIKDFFAGRKNTPPIADRDDSQ